MGGLAPQRPGRADELAVMTRRRLSRPLTEEERALWRRTAKAFKPLDAQRLKQLGDPGPATGEERLSPQGGPV